ncbi:MAG: LytR C-terminal domain-containing protein [candidate division Zixibacteria bacterium]|nr:LytR C-terminal domain-containing protein [candidate division Zixibacteria bacterium]
MLNKKVNRRTKRSSKKKEKPRILVITGIATSVLVLFAIIFLISTFRQVTVESSPMLSDSIVRVQVLNGCGLKGLADRVSELIRKNSSEAVVFDVVEVKNAPVFGFERTLVVSRTQQTEAAEIIAKNINVNNEILIERLIRNPLEIDVTVVVGSDYEELGI